MLIKIPQKNKKALQFDLTAGRIIKPETNVLIAKQAVIYCRVSSDSQVFQGHGLESQEWICRTRCENNNIEVVGIFKDEGISGANLNRNWLNSAISFLREQNKNYKQIGYFICTEESRISRSENLLDTLELDWRIRATGADIVYAFGNIDTSTDEWKMLNQIKYVIASQERQRIAKRARNWIMERLKQWYRPFKDVPTGYTKARENGRNMVILDDEKWQVIKTGLEGYANGTFETQLDLYKFRVEKGLSTNSKKHSGVLHFSFMATTLNVQKIFFYAGKILFPSWWIEEPIEGQHVSLISIDIAKTILAKLSGRIRKKVVTTDEQFLAFQLRGLIRCEKCNGMIQCWYTKNHQGKRYPYYGCCKRWCSHRSNIPKDKFEKQFLNMFKKLDTTDIIVNLRKTTLLNEFERKSKGIEKIKTAWKQRLYQIGKKQEEITRLLPKINTEGLLDSMQNEWQLLEAEKQNVLREQNSAIVNRDTIYTFIENSTKILEDPLDFWLRLNNKQKSKFIKVRFGWEIFHSSFNGFRTKWKTGLYHVFQQFSKMQISGSTLDRSNFELLDSIISVIPSLTIALADLLNSFSGN